MHKYLFLITLMVAFALSSCEKENKENQISERDGMVTFEMAGELNQSDSKQTLHAPACQIFFDNSDNVLLSRNGGNAFDTLNVYPVPISGNPFATEYCSYKAEFSVPVEYTVEPFVIKYPASAFFNNGHRVLMEPEVTLIPADGTMHVMYSANQSWPMTAYVPGTNTTRIQLKNTIAIATPAVKYGFPFINKFTSDYASDLPIVNPNEPPVLYIDRIDLVSDDNILWGEGYINGLETEEPTLGIFSNTGGHRLICHAPHAPMGVFAVDHTTDNGEVLIGNVPIPPMHTGQHIKMNVYFRLEYDDGYVFYCKYCGNNLTIPNDEVLGRSRRAILICDMFNAYPDGKVICYPDGWPDFL